MQTNVTPDPTEQAYDELLEAQGEYIYTGEFFDPSLMPMILSSALSLVGTLVGLTALETAIGRNLRQGFWGILKRNSLVVAVGAFFYLLAGYDLMYHGDEPPFVNGTWWLLKFEELGSGGSESYGYIGLSMTGWVDLTYQSLLVVDAALVFTAVLAQTTGLRMTLLAASIFCLVTYPVAGELSWGGGLLNARGFMDFAGANQLYLLAGSAALGWMLFQPRETMPIQLRPDLRTERKICLGIAAICWGLPIPAGGMDGVLFSALISVLVAVTGLVTGLLLAPRRIGWSILIALVAGLAAGMGAEVPSVGLSIGAAAVAVLLDWLISRAGYRDPVGAVAAFGVGGLLGTLHAGFHPRSDDGGVAIQLLGSAITVLWAGGTWAALSICWRIFTKVRQLGEPPATKEMTASDA